MDSLIVSITKFVNISIHFDIWIFLNEIVSYKRKDPMEVVTVTTILTIRIRCPKTVNLFNKAHQHMRGTSCTNFTL